MTGAFFSEKGILLYGGEFPRWAQTGDDTYTWPGAWTSEIRLFKLD